MTARPPAASDSLRPNPQDEIRPKQEADEDRRGDQPAAARPRGHDHDRGDDGDHDRRDERGQRPSGQAGILDATWILAKASHSGKLTVTTRYLADDRVPTLARDTSPVRVDGRCRIYKSPRCWGHWGTFSGLLMSCVLPTVLAPTGRPRKPGATPREIDMILVLSSERAAAFLPQP